MLGITCASSKHLCKHTRCGTTAWTPDYILCRGFCIFHWVSENTSWLHSKPVRCGTCIRMQYRRHCYHSYCNYSRYGIYWACVIQCRPLQTFASDDSIVTTWVRILGWVESDVMYWWLYSLKLVSEAESELPLAPSGIGWVSWRPWSQYCACSFSPGLSFLRARYCVTICWTDHILREFCSNDFPLDVASLPWITNVCRTYACWAMR